MSEQQHTVSISEHIRVSKPAKTLRHTVAHLAKAFVTTIHKGQHEEDTPASLKARLELALRFFASTWQSIAWSEHQRCAQQSLVIHSNISSVRLTLD